MKVISKYSLETIIIKHIEKYIINHTRAKFTQRTVPSVIPRILEKKTILLSFRVVQVALMLSENDMQRKTGSRLKNILLIGKPTAEVQDQDVISKWQK